MKQLLVVLLGLLFYGSPLEPQKPVGQPATQAGLDTASAELVKLTHAWTDASTAKDHSKLEALMAPEFALYGWDGQRWAPRPDWLDTVDRIKTKEYTVRDVSARAYGDFGVVTSTCTWVGVDDQGPFTLHCVLVDTWRRTNGKWQVVARNSCRVSSASASTPSPCASPRE